MRTWVLYGVYRGETHNGEPSITSVRSTARLVRFSGGTRETIKKVTFQENPEGQYTGWLEKDATEVSRIQRTEIFPIQFPYAIAEYEAKGYGVRVPLTVVSIGDLEGKEYE